MEWNAIPKTAAEVYPISFTVRLIRKGISMEQEENKNQIQVIRVTEEWQRAGVHYVRVEGMLKEFPDITLAMEFDTDTPDTRYTLVLEGNMPVATVRLHVLDEHTGKIERVVTVGSARKKGYGALAMKEAEAWLKDLGISHIVVTSRTVAVGFYEKLGYTPDWTKTRGEGDFRLVLVEKEI